MTCGLRRDGTHDGVGRAVAPHVVFIVRIYGTRPSYEVRKFSSHEPRTSRSATRDITHSRIAAQVRATQRPQTTSDSEAE